MSASTTCRRPGGQAGSLRLPASPVLLAGAALMQRLLTSDRRGRRRGPHDRDEARAGRGAQRQPARGEGKAGERQAGAGDRAGASGEGKVTDRNNTAAGTAKRSEKCRHDRGCHQHRRSRRGRGCRCCTVPRRILSMAVAGASVALMVRGVQELTGARTTLDPHAPETSSQLVTTGPFAYTRNPLYLAGAGLLWAHALWLGSPRALLPAGAFVLALDKCQIPLEEAALEQRFGKKYRKYAAEVPRWVVR